MTDDLWQEAQEKHWRICDGDCKDCREQIQLEEEKGFNDGGM